ncbi:MAG: type II toxin-antitoxin system RelE/ParE family toxin [Rickettsiales bacterium]
MTEIFKLSDLAQYDYEDILSYIAEGNLSAAKQVRIEFSKTFALLAENPNIGHKRSDITSKPVRFWNLYSYQIIYVENTSPLQILRILSGYRDLANILED